MNQIQEEMRSNKDGSFAYDNSREKECIYVYTLVPNTEWICVTCTPFASFHSVDIDLRFTVLLICIFVLLLVIDVSYLIELNRRLKTSARDAFNANQAKTDFLSRMSHDIRTPINVIIGMTDLAIEEDNEEQKKDYLMNMQSSGKFLLGLVNDILDMNKVESGKMELHPVPYKYSEFCVYIKTVISPLCASKNIHFNMSSNVEEWTLMLDGLRINQIFFNLLSNAVKFTPENGNISLHLEVEKTDSNQMLLHFIVSDDGIGMSKEFQKEMFQAFTQEKKAISNDMMGTGLGLPIVKSLVDLMHGKIKVDSVEGRGSVFHIEIKADIVDKKEEEKKKDNIVASLAHKKVLLCEDHPLNSQIIVRILEKKKMQVEVAENGRIGVDMFLQHEEFYYDLILMDVRMPIMDGLEATRMIRGLQNRRDAIQIPIIALTANAYDVDVKNCLDAGMNYHLAKPIDTNVLYETLLKMIKS